MSFLKRILLACAVMALMLAALSCRSLTAPPGFASRGKGTAGRIEFPAGISLEAQYSLLVWYCQQHGREARRQAGDAFGLAVTARNERAMLLRGIAAHSLVTRYPDFAYVPPQKGIAFHFGNLAERKDFPEMDAMVSVCMETISFPRTIAVPVEECAAYLRESQEEAQSLEFRRWAQSHSRLELGMPEEALLGQLRHCSEALSRKARLLKAQEEAQALLAQGIGDSRVLELLEAAQKEWSDGRALEILGDTTTIPSLQKMLADAPVLCVDAVLGRWPSGDLDAFEADLSNALSSWEKDSRFCDALLGHDSAIQTVVREAYQARKDRISAEAKRISVTHGYRQWILETRRKAASLRMGDAGEWDCYARYGLSQELSEFLQEEESTLLPEAEEYYLQAQKDMLQISGKPTVALVLGEILEELCGAVPPEAARRMEQVRQMTEEFLPKYALCLDEFTSEEAGVGRIWSHDLAFRLEKLRSEWNAAALFEIASSSEEADCLLAAGDLLEFSAGEIESRVIQNWHRWHDNPRMETVPSLSFVQEEWEEEIAVQTSTRAGHVRFRGRLDFMHGGCREIVLNEFFPVEFVHETSGEKRRVGEFRCADQRELKPVGGPASLRKERIWSAGEVLDFARQGALEHLAAFVVTALLEGFRDEAQAVTSPLERAEALDALLDLTTHLTAPDGSAVQTLAGQYSAELPEVIREAVAQGLTRSEQQ